MKNCYDGACIDAGVHRATLSSSICNGSLVIGQQTMSSSFLSIPESDASGAGGCIDECGFLVPCGEYSTGLYRLPASGFPLPGTGS